MLSFVWPDMVCYCLIAYAFLCDLFPIIRERYFRKGVNPVGHIMIDFYVCALLTCTYMYMSCINTISTVFCVTYIKCNLQCRRIL